MGLRPRARALRARGAPLLCLLTNLISLKIDNKEIGRQFPGLDSSPDLKNGTTLAVLSLAGKEPEDTETLKI